MKIMILALFAGAAGCGSLDWNHLANPQIEHGGVQETRYESPATGMSVRGGTVGNPSPQIMAGAQAHAMSVTAEADATYRLAEAEHIPTAEGQILASEAQIGRARAEYISARAECIREFGPIQCEGYGFGFGYGLSGQPAVSPQYRDTLAGMVAAGQMSRALPSPASAVDVQAREAIRALGGAVQEHVEEIEVRVAPQARGGSR